MTREQAIKWLKESLKQTDFQYEQMETAVEMGISALEGINRLEAEVTEEHNKFYETNGWDEWQQGEHYAYHRILQMIADMRCEE